MKIRFEAIMIIFFMSVFFISGCTNKSIKMAENKSYITWYYDKSEIDINIYVENNYSSQAEFYLYIVNRNDDIANSLDFRTLPIEDGKLFSVDGGDEVHINQTIELPKDVMITEQVLAEAYEVIVGYMESPEKEKQSTYQITEVNVIKGK